MRILIYCHIITIESIGQLTPQSFFPFWATFSKPSFSFKFPLSLPRDLPLGLGWGTQILQVSVFKKIRCKASLNLFLGKLLKSDFFKKFYNYLKVWTGCSKKRLNKISVHDVTVGLEVSFLLLLHTSVVLHGLGLVVIKQMKMIYILPPWILISNILES